MTNLVEGLRPRVELMMYHVAKAMKASGEYNGGASWDTWPIGYQSGERLVGELYTENAIYWHRPLTFAGTDKAVVYTKNIVPTNLVNQQFGDEVTIQAGVEERFSNRLDIAEGTTYEDTVSHTFTTTTSREDAYKQGLKLSLEEWIRGGAGGSQSGLAVGVTAKQEFTADFEQKYGAGTAKSDTLSRKLTIPGPWSGTYEFVRSLDKKQQRVTAQADYEFAIEIYDTHQQVSWNNNFDKVFNINPQYHNVFGFGFNSFAELLSVMRREAPSTYALYGAFMNSYKMSEDDIMRVAAPPGESSFLMNFDSVNSADVLIRKTIKATPLTPATPIKDK